jgi:hypothetical protein
MVEKILKVKKCNTRIAGGCSACFRIDLDTQRYTYDEVYQITLGRTVIRLCHECMIDLIRELL